MKTKKSKTTRYQIDQSIKIENTSKATYVGISNGTQVIISILAHDKRALKQVFRKLKKPLVFKVFTFSVLCAKVLEKSRTKFVIIDREYQGHEIDIKNYIVQLLRLAGKPIPDIHFSLIGKNSHAHHRVYQAHTTKKMDKLVNKKRPDALWIAWSRMVTTGYYPIQSSFITPILTKMTEIVKKTP